MSGSQKEELEPKAPAEIQAESAAADESAAPVPEIVRLTKAALEDKKAHNIKIIDISKVSVLADYFIIADGANAKQVQAMVDNVEEVLGKAGYVCRQIEGYGTANWILMDYGDMIVHAFCREDRLFYDLERIWRDGRQVEIDV